MLNRFTLSLLIGTHMQGQITVHMGGQTNSQGSHLLSYIPRPTFTYNNVVKLFLAYGVLKLTLLI